MPIKKLTNKSIILIVALIMLIQCAVLVFWQTKRGNYYIDELYCFGYAKNYAQDSSEYITDSELWKYNEWLEADDLVSELKIQKEDRLSSLPVSQRLQLLAGKRTYMGLLNIILASADSFREYCWRALALNTLFYLVAEILLLFCVRKLTGSNSIAILSIIMFGFSAIMIGICEYVRFYMYTTMLLLVVLMCHLMLWDERRPYVFFMWEIPAFVAAYYGLMHSEFFLVICGTFFPLFIVAMLFRKRFINALVYCAPLLLGGFRYVYQQTDLIYAALHISDYAQENAHGKHGTAYRLMNINWQDCRTAIRIMKHSFVDKWLGSEITAAAFAILLVVGIVLVIKKRGQKQQDKNSYFVFIILIAVTAGVSLLFNVLATLSAARYQVYIVVMLIIVLFYGISALHRRLRDERLLIAFFAVTIVSAIICQQADRFPHLYTNDRAVMDKVEKYSKMDTIIYETYSARHAVYDCLSHCSEGTKIYANEPSEELSLKQINAPDQFVAWCTNIPSFCKMVRSIQAADYRMTPLGVTHENRIFLCTKNK